MPNPSFEIEDIYTGPIAGIDEAGCGAWAGPVVAAAVIFLDRERATPLFSKLNDSKKLTKKERNEAFEALQEEESIVIGVGSASETEIDQINIRQATLNAMLRAVDALKITPNNLLIDGICAPKCNIPCHTIKKGDQKSFSIASASIIAKVTRDRIMSELDLKYPGYGLADNVGYGTKKHILGLQDRGISEIHRKTYKPIQQFLTQPV